MLVFRLIIESFRFAWQALRSNLLRTTLSLLGVTIGIFTIITVYTILDSLEKGFRKSFAFVGENVIYVQKWPWLFEDNYPWWKYFNRPEPSYAEYKFLEDNVNYSAGVAIFTDRSGVTLKRANNSISNIDLLGISYQYNVVSEIPIEKGRYFSIQEIESGKNAAIIGADVVSNLFPNQDPIGKEIKVKGLKFVVIGVMERQGANFLEGVPSHDLQCFIPFKVFLKLYYSGSNGGVSAALMFKGRPDDPGLVELENEVRGLMRARRGLKPKEIDDFSINRPEMLATMISSIFSFLSVAGGIIGSFSLIVGCFGIANIMFVSVKERTNIIGIQKSLGAKNYFILFQFLFEAVFLSVIGGGVGILLVSLITLIPMGTLEVTMSLANIVRGLSIATFIGCLAGIIPAALASRLDPVIAIRSK